MFFEEKELQHRFKEEFRQYKSNTNLIIPWFEKRLLLALFIGLILKIDMVWAGSYNRERTFVIEEKIALKISPSDAVNLRLWIPYPASDSLQTVNEVSLDSPLRARLIEDKENRNKIFYISSEGNFDKSEIEMILLFKVNRKESDSFYERPGSHKIPSYFLKANRLVPVTGPIKELAQKITKEKNTDLDKVRAIYDYIIDALAYSKDDPNICGIGNSLLTLKHKKGICTDYHSLFISLVRSLGIPAKFEIGFRMPERESEGKLNGYHCWAKFYLKDKGWIPVDISEADKHPEKRDYFFGRLDENRIHLTTGRDITLKYARDSQPLNFFVYPYAELNGRHFDNMKVEIFYRDLKGGE